MDLDVFDEWAQEECMFIGELMENEGLTEVLLSCLQLGREELSERVDDYQQVKRDFFHTPRPERIALLDQITEKQDRHAVLVALLHEARCAALLLEKLRKYGASAGAAGSKSMMMTQASQVAKEVAEQFPSLYPFAEDEPFGMTPKWFSRDA